jgi:predicted glycoside hydrolase/deacetylase ChbG (UPF0249 family)
VQLELRRQWQQYVDWVGQPPAVVNGHHHVHVFPLVREVLTELLSQQQPRPYLRRVREPWTTIRRIPGCRGKRLFLNQLGTSAAGLAQRHLLPGNDWLLGLNGTHCLARPDCLRSVPGQVVELMCHPGLLDPSLLGRDAVCVPALEKRAQEMSCLADPRFLQACRLAGFTLVTPRAILPVRPERKAHAA